MDPAAIPSGGIPWILAGPAFIFLVGVSIAVVKWIALRADRKIEEKENQLAIASQEKERLRVELTAQIKALEDEVQDELRKALDMAYAGLRREPPRPAVPPPGVVRSKKSTRELLNEVREVTGRFRREDLLDDATRDA